MSSFKNQKNSELQCFKFIISQFKQRGYPYLGRMMFGKPPAIFDGTALRVPNLQSKSEHMLSAISEWVDAAKEREETK